MRILKLINIKKIPFIIVLPMISRLLQEKKLKKLAIKNKKKLIKTNLIYSLDVVMKSIFVSIKRNVKKELLNCQLLTALSPVLL